MRVTYDHSSDMGYIYLKQHIAPGEVKRSVPCFGLVTLDYDHAGHLVGIELFDAMGALPPEAMLEAEKLPPPPS